jgi:hypothetical protein
MVAVIGLLLALFVIGALLHLFRQPTEAALERAAFEIFVVMGLLIAIVITAAIIVRKRTGATWSNEEALRMAGERQEGRLPKGRYPRNRS